MPIAPARVAWYVTGRFYEDEDQKIQDLGYFLHLGKVEGSLFTGTTLGEATALLTFRSAPFTAQGITNGNLAIGLDAVGEFSVYLNPAAGADFADPDSFSRGERIATFRRLTVVAGTTLSSPALGGLAIGMNVFSADLIESTPFKLGGIRYDFRELLPHGITQWGTASENPLAAFSPYTRVVAFTGSAIAAGPEG
jgi:hypothetical protein